MASCNIRYIQERYVDYPKLVDRLIDIEVDIWKQLKTSGVFREYDRTLLFSKKGTKNYIKQKDLLNKIDTSLNAPSSLFIETPTKSGFNTKVRVAVHPIAQMVYDQIEAEELLNTPVIQGDLFDISPIIEEPVETVENISTTQLTEGDILIKINELKENVVGIYKGIFEVSPMEALYTIAVQANTSEGDRRGATSAVGTEMVNLALYRFPDANINVSFDEYTAPTEENEQEELAYIDEENITNEDVEEKSIPLTSEEEEIENQRIAENEQKLNDLLNNGEITTFCG